jgi:nucleotide-binding universal stress UspA family protein
MNTIVVAVDGSAASGAALRFAIGEAGLRGTRVLLICPCEVPVSLFAGRASRAVDPRSFEHTAEQTVENALADAHRLDPDIPCEARAIHGRRIAKGLHPLPR